MGGWALIRSSIRTRRSGYLAGIGASLLWALAKVTVPLLVRAAIDRGIEPRNGAVLAWLSLAIVGVGTVGAVCAGLRRYLAFDTARGIEMALRSRMFSHIQSLDFGYHDRTRAGDLMSRATSDLQQVQNFCNMLPITAGNLVTVTGVVFILFWLDALLAACALAILPVLNVLGRRFSQLLHPAVAGIQRSSGELSNVVEEAVAGVRVVKGLGAEEVLADRLAVQAEAVYGSATQAAGVRARYVPAIEAVPNIAVLAVLAVGGLRVIDGALTVGDLVAFNVYVGLLVAPLRSLGWIIALAQRAGAAADRVAEVLSAPSAVTAPNDPVALPARSATSGAVEFDGVRFAYPSGADTAVFDGLDLRLAAGESVAIVGETGSGKSTVVRLLARFYDVDAGSIRLDGVDVRSLDLDALRSSVAIVFEETLLFNDTIAANIAFADPDASVERIEEAARLSGAHQFISELAEGYDTMVGERGFSLSGGQRQRLAIARALLGRPRVLVLDDATSAVDPTKEREIRDTLRTALDGLTTVVITHRVATIALADRVVLVDGNRVAATGTHEHLMATCDRYARVLASAAATT